jgi:TatD DNase family protein
MLVDSHANLHGDAYAEDLEPVLERARAAGVGTIVAICCRLEEFERVLKIAEAHDDLWATIGQHPHHAKDRPDVSPAWLAALAAHPKVIGIGETGLDRHYNYSPEDLQIKSFLAHVEAARLSGLPLVIHCREADELMAGLLEREMAKAPFRFLLHSYTSGPDLARRGAALGGYFSVNGIASFRNAHDVREMIRDIMPADRILLETDCPYLAPAPMRGRRNEPAFLPHVAAALAAARDWTPEETATRTTDAFFDLFTKAARPAAP